MVKKTNYMDWDKFKGEDIPSSLETYDLLYNNIEIGYHIVDIGCGYGKTSFELVSKGYGPIVGFDINPAGINFAKETLKNIPEQYKDMIKFEIRDALKTEFPDNSFDAGIMQAFLTTMTTPEDRLAALKETRRIIKPSGGLYIAVFVQTWHTEKYLKKYENGERETGERGSFYAYNKKTGELEYQAHHYSEHEIVYLLKEAGFSIIEFEYKKFTTRSGNKTNGAVIWAR